MINKKNPPLNEIHEQLQIMVDCFGPQLRFTPARTDDIARNEMSESQRHITLDKLKLIQQNKPLYQNVKINLDSVAPEGYGIIMIDYDDHDGKGVSKGLDSFGLPPTFTVNTPTGEGRHEYYLLELSKAQTLTSHKYVIGKETSIEIFVGYENKNKIHNAPGGFKDSGQYLITNPIKPAMLPEKLFKALEIQASHAESVARENREKNMYRFKTDVDSPTNKSDYLNKVNTIAAQFELGTKEPLMEGRPDERGRGRDDLVFELACDGFDFNLSADTIHDLLMFRIVGNEKVIADDFSEDQLVEKINSAAKLTTKGIKSRDDTHDLFERDEYGYSKILMKDLEEKAGYLSRFSTRKILDTDHLRNMLCEMFFVCDTTGTFFLANKLSDKEYKKRYNQSLAIELEGDNQINMQEILQLKSDTTLGWKQYTASQVKEMFTVDMAGRSKPLKDLPCFKLHSNTGKITNAKSSEGLFLDGHLCFMSSKAPIEPLEDATKEEKEEAMALLMSHVRRLVDPEHYDEESKWLIDKYALMLQDPLIKLDNVVVFKGNQGSGKTSFMEILMLMFPRDETNIIYNVAELESTFKEINRVTHVDDIDLDLDKKVVNNLKALTSGSLRPRERKFQNRTLEIGPINMSMSTNNDITDPEILGGRRWTIPVNNELFDTEVVGREVKETYVKLKANDWRLYRALHSALLEREVKNFKSNYKTHAQKRMIAGSNGKSELFLGLLNMIANYGYVGPSLQPFKPGTLMNLNDFAAVMIDYYGDVDDGPLKEQRVANLSNIPKKGFANMTSNKSAKQAFKLYFPQDEMIKKCPSNIDTDRLNYTTARKVPNIQDWIKVLAAEAMGGASPDMVEYVVNKYNLKEQWEWDNETKPEIKNLGMINALEFIDDEDFEDDDDY